MPLAAPTISLAPGSAFRNVRLGGIAIWSSRCVGQIRLRPFTRPTLFVYTLPAEMYISALWTNVMSMTAREGTLSTVAARDKFAEVLNRAAFGKERVVLTRRGKPLVAVVPIEDVEVLEHLEDQADAEQARAALTGWRAEGSPSASLDDVLAEHSLSRDDLCR